MSYNITLTNGGTLVDIPPSENDGTGNLSAPIKVHNVLVNTTNGQLSFVVPTDVTSRFVPGFAFSIVGDTAYDGAYTVAGAGSSYTPINSVMYTVIPVNEAIQNDEYVVAFVNPTTDTVYIHSNSACEFVPTKTVTVAGNSNGASNGTYTVESSEVSGTYNISAVNATSNTWSITGDYTKFFRPGMTFVVTGNNTTGNGTYTVTSSVFSAGETVVTVTEDILNGTNSSGNITVSPTIVAVTTVEDLPAGTTATGTIARSPVSAITLVHATAPVVEVVTTNVYNITFTLAGDHTAVFNQYISTGCEVLIKDNNVLVHNSVAVVTVTYNAGNSTTALTVRYTSLTSPAVTATGTVVIPPLSLPYGFLEYASPVVSSPLQLVGRGASRYNATTPWGAALQNNLVRILENFSNTTAPTAPLRGQLWFDTGTPQLNVRDTNSTWKSVFVGGVATPASLVLSGTGGIQITGTGTIDMNSNRILNVSLPSTGTDAANKSYVDSLSSGIVWIQPILDANLYDDSLGAPPTVPAPYVDYDRTFLVKPAQYTVVGVTTGASGVWSISGNHASTIVSGDTFKVIGNADGPSNATYTVVSSVNNGGNTDITVASIPAGATVSGTVLHSSGDWNGLDGRIVLFDTVLAAWVDILQRTVQAGDRFGVFIDPNNYDPLSALAGGGLTGHTGQVAILSTVNTDTFATTWTFYTPQEPDAVSVVSDKSRSFGSSYTFRGTWNTGTYGTDYMWIEFAGPTAIVDGAGLNYQGNTLYIGQGTGIVVSANTIALDTTYTNNAYIRRDGTNSPTANIDMGTFKLTNIGAPTVGTDATNLTYTNGAYIRRDGTNSPTANIDMGTFKITNLGAPTVGSDAVTLTYAGNTYQAKNTIQNDVSVFTIGAPGASAVILRRVAVRTMAFTLASSRAVAEVAATASTVFSIKRNGVEFGTITFDAAATVGTFAVVSAPDATHVANDKLEIIAPAVPDATLADLTITLYALV